MKFCAVFIVAIPCLVFSPGSGAATAATPSRVAVWDPVKGTDQPANRFVLNLGQLDEAAKELKAAGCEVSRLTAEQIADDKTFSADQFDVLIMPGDAFPKIDIKGIEAFADGGGVPLLIHAPAPFQVQIAQNPQGMWTMTPTTPVYGWQVLTLENFFAARFVYNPSMMDLGVRHLSTPLLKKYLPQAPDQVDKSLPGVFVVPLTTAGTRGGFFPLLRSKRVDGGDTTPQMYVTESGKRRAIVCASDIFTSDRDTSIWPVPKETLLALVHLAKDLHDGVDVLAAADRIDYDANMRPPEPLRSRLTTGSVDPVGSKAIVRWGKFDGSSMEFGDLIDEGKTASVPAGAPDNQFPHGLAAGASVEVALPPLGKGQRFLRIRGAFQTAGAGLGASIGKTVVLSELFTSADASGAGNFTEGQAQPVEFTRIAYIPGDASGPTLRLFNPGKQPVYFDAVQIEEHPSPAPDMAIGLMALNQKVISTDYSQHWKWLRSNIRTQYIGEPGTVDWFKHADELFPEFTIADCPIQLLIEGTPQWAAVSPERYASGQKAGRPHTVPPDADKFQPVVEELVKHFGSKVSIYEVWNEPNIQQFWRGTPEEYADFFLKTAATIRKLDPGKRIMSAGMAGFRPSFCDVMVDKGVFKSADLVGLHPYSGQAPAWDVIYGSLDGYLMSKGVSTEIYCDESGFPYTNEEWFTSGFTPEKQRDDLAIAMARTLADGLAKLNVFHAGGIEKFGTYGMFDPAGKPMPAYAVFSDYAQLNRDNGRRLDVGLAPADGVPLQGIYIASASHDDGAVTAVISPVESPVYSRRVILHIPLPKTGDYKATITTAGGPPAAQSLSIHDANGAHWAEAEVEVRSRCVVNLMQ